jgi:hypothetical protein
LLHYEHHVTLINATLIPHTMGALASEMNTTGDVLLPASRHELSMLAFNVAFFDISQGEREGEIRIKSEANTQNKKD